VFACGGISGLVDRARALPDRTSADRQGADGARLIDDARVTDRRAFGADALHERRRERLFVNVEAQPAIEQHDGTEQVEVAVPALRAEADGDRASPGAGEAEITPLVDAARAVRRHAAVDRVDVSNREL